MSKEAMELALEALEGLEALLLSMGLTHLIVYGDAEKAITNLQKELANEALDKMAENARELGLDYELQDKDPDLIEQPAQQEPVAWPAGLIERIKAAEQRIQYGHAPRRIPADPTDVDLVLAEVRYLLEGKQPPFWVNTPPPAQPSKPLTDEQIEAIHQSTWIQSTATLNDFARAIEAAHGIKEKANDGN